LISKQVFCRIVDFSAFYALSCVSLDELCFQFAVIAILAYDYSDHKVGYFFISTKEFVSVCTFIGRFARRCSKLHESIFILDVL